MAQMYDSRALRRPGAILAGADETSAFLWGVYRWMTVGLAVTGLVALVTVSSPAMLDFIFGNRIVFYGLLIGELAMVMTFSAMAQRVSGATAALMFIGYAALNGLTFASIFLAYTQASIAQVFFVTAGAFAALSFYGSVTRRDLSPIGRFMFMGLIGLIIASVVNIFWANPALYWVSTYAGVLIFAGLTAYDTQKLKALYAEHGASGNLALQGALVLYLDFINLFLMMLRLFGSRR